VPLAGFTSRGDLPEGIHKASLADVNARFGSGTVQRKVIALRLERIHRISVTTGHLKRFVIFGSYVTSKSAPNDVDIFMIMDDDFDMSRLTGEARLLFEHGVAQDHFGASVFWLRSLAAFGGEQAAIEQWQVKRDGTERGIVEIIAE